MRSAPTTSRNSKQSSGQLKYGYESKGLDRPSVQILRGDFLSLLLNLESEWCLDDMLDFLRRFDAAKDKVLANTLRADGDGFFLKQVIFRCWQETVHERRYSGLVSQFTSNILVEEAGAFTFSFVCEEIELKVSGPFNKTWKQFEHDVDREFRNAGGPIVRGARKQLKLKLQDYRERVEQLAKDMDLVKAPVMWAVDQHLEWLVQFQVPPCNAYKQTAAIYGKDERTIREGVAVVARLIDLPLRQSRAGRPTGVKETVPRRRTIRR